MIRLNDVRFNKTIRDNAGPQNTTVPIYFCPARRSPQVCTATFMNAPPGACSDYAVVGGDNTLNTGAFHINDLYGAGIKLTEITDGTSSTLMVGEKHLAPLDLQSGQFDGYVYSANPSGLSFRQAGSAHPLALGTTDAQNGQFGSWHTNLVHFVFCDGHVAGLSTSLPGTTLGFLATRAGGETPSDYE